MGLKSSYAMFTVFGCKLLAFLTADCGLRTHSLRTFATLSGASGHAVGQRQSGGAQGGAQLWIPVPLAARSVTK
jgi:hypothetical protein